MIELGTLRRKGLENGQSPAGFSCSLKSDTCIMLGIKSASEYTDRQGAFQEINFTDENIRIC